MAGLNRSIPNSDQTMGDLERKLLEEASQKKADRSAPVCPVWGNKLNRFSPGQERTYPSRFGPVRVGRSRGWCRRLQSVAFSRRRCLGFGSDWKRFAFGAGDGGVAGQQDAGGRSQRRAGAFDGGEALPPATLDREARRQGKRAERKRKELDEPMSAGKGCGQCVPLGRQPFTLVIEIDAWNIRERDHWGQSQQQRAKGVEPERWHWVYGGTCFRWDPRSQTDSGRPIILSRGTVMTRGGVEALREQLFAECLRHGAGQAAEVLVIADGAMWIWNRVADRFSTATHFIMPASSCGRWLTRCIRKMRGRHINGSNPCSKNSRPDGRSK